MSLYRFAERGRCRELFGLSALDSHPRDGSVPYRASYFQVSEWCRRVEIFVYLCDGYSSG
jgi:hypothetical protein